MRMKALNLPDTPGHPWPSVSSLTHTQGAAMNLSYAAKFRAVACDGCARKFEDGEQVCVVEVQPQGADFSVNCVTCSDCAEDFDEVGPRALSRHGWLGVVFARVMPAKAGAQFAGHNGPSMALCVLIRSWDELTHTMHAFGRHFHGARGPKPKSRAPFG